jgi:predicted phage tail protein
MVNGELLNEYTELYITKSGKDLITNSFCGKKCSVSKNLNQLFVGSSYSLSLINNSPKIFKIFSMSENYINEYNILASEYNLDKFKEIEDNYQIDNLENTFNALNKNNYVTKSSSKELLAATVIYSVSKVQYGNISYLEIKWGNVINATSFDVYIQTPSSHTSNFIMSATYDADFNKNLNLYVKTWQLPISNMEIGTYIISIQSVSTLLANRFSPLAKRSITIMNY